MDWHVVLPPTTQHETDSNDHNRHVSLRSLLLSRHGTRAILILCRILSDSGKPDEHLPNELDLRG
jgi:hypothetical protein